MSVDFAASTDRASKFDSVWHVDFEYRQDANHHPVPVSMSAFDELSGTEIFLCRDELLKLKFAPFGTGPRDLMIAYAAIAELSCFLALGWPFPRNMLDLYVETGAFLNGRLDIWPEKRRPKLIEALELFDLPSMPKARKDAMRDLILGKEEYTEEEWRQIKGYNRDDVVGSLGLRAALSPTLDWPHALHRGRYVASTTHVEWCGLPVDVPRLHQFADNWEVLQLHYIQRDDVFGLYDGTKFCEDRLWALVADRRWDWPRTPHGRLVLERETLARQARRYPELKRLVHLRNTIAELRLNKLVASVGADGFSRCALLPFWTRTGRNQPADEASVFLPSLPSWLRGLLRPPEGWALIELDWSAQEVAIMAALSGDPAMIADYKTGDPHTQFGIRAGLLTEDQPPEIRASIRDKMCKPVVHGTNYGMTAYGIAAKTGRSLLWARDIHARHRRAYPVFHQWLGDMVAQAKFDGVIASPFGWPMAVVADTNHRAIMNFPAQAGGADAMRIALIAAVEAGIRVAAPVHDAFWLLCPIDKVDDTIATMTNIMRKAGAAVTGGLEIGVKVAAVVRAPQCLGDCWTPRDKGYAMWTEVRDLLAGGIRRTGA
jgi:DNA polymerase I